MIVWGILPYVIDGYDLVVDPIRIQNIDKILNISYARKKL